MLHAPAVSLASDIETLLQTYGMNLPDVRPDGLPASPFLRLPFEIRLMIYEYLLLPSTTPSTGQGTSVANLLPDAFHTYFSEDTNNDPSTLSVRTIDPWLGSQGSRTWRRRSTYHVRTGKSHTLLFRIPTWTFYEPDSEILSECSMDLVRKVC